MDVEKKKDMMSYLDKLNSMSYVYDRERLISERRDVLRYKPNNLLEFLSKLVIGSNTASLIKTDILLKKDIGYNKRVVKTLLTINSSGFGTINDCDDGYVWGSTKSSAMTDKELQKYLLDPEIQKKLIAFLEKDNKQKMKNICETVFEKIHLINKIQEVTKKYEEAGFIINTPLIEVTEQRRNFDGTNRIYYNKIKSDKIIFSYNTIIHFTSKMREFLDQDELMKIVNQWGNNTTESIYLKLNTMEGLTTLYYIKESIDKALQELEETLTRDEHEVSIHEDEIQREFGIYQLKKGLKK
jgi:hypothetical protein